MNVRRALLCALLLAAGGPAAARAGTVEGLEPPPGLAAFAEVRLRWSKQPYIQPYWELASGRSAIFDAYRAGRHEVVREHSGRWLRAFPIDAPVHYMRAQALEALGDHAGSARHRYWYRGLIASVLASGDGSTPARAMQVVALREEHFVIRDRGATVRRQEVVEVGDGTYHKVELERAGEVQTLYFDISIPFKQLENAFPAAPR